MGELEISSEALLSDTDNESPPEADVTAGKKEGTSTGRLLSDVSLLELCISRSPPLSLVWSLEICHTKCALQ